MIENSGTSLRGMLEVQHDSSVILLRMVQHRLTNTLVRERLSPDGRLWLGDLPGGLAPLATRRWLWLWKREPLEVLSGGDRLAPGTWLWQFDAEGHGSVVERRPPDAAGI